MQLFGNFETLKNVTPFLSPAHEVGAEGGGVFSSQYLAVRPYVCAHVRLCVRVQFADYISEIVSRIVFILHTLIPQGV